MISNRTCPLIPPSGTPHYSTPSRRHYCTVVGARIVIVIIVAIGLVLLPLRLLMFGRLMTSPGFLGFLTLCLLPVPSCCLVPLPIALFCLTLALCFFARMPAMLLFHLIVLPFSIFLARPAKPFFLLTRFAAMIFLGTLTISITAFVDTFAPFLLNTALFSIPPIVMVRTVIRVVVSAARAPEFAARASISRHTVSVKINVIFGNDSVIVGGVVVARVVIRVVRIPVTRAIMARARTPDKTNDR